MLLHKGQGKVTFNGTVVDAPCGIDAQSADQSIEFGQVSKVLLNNGGSSTPKNFDIKLTDCDVTNYKKAGKAGTVSLTFSGFKLVPICCKQLVRLIQQFLLQILMAKQ